MEIIIALILSIAAEFAIPLYFALAVATVENPDLDPLAVNINQNGTRDLGIMQLNDSWFFGDWEHEETNIRAGCLLIKELIGKPELNTYWAVAAAYNCGYIRFVTIWPPPDSTIEYANRVMYKWNDLQPGGAHTMIRDIP